VRAVGYFCVERPEYWVGRLLRYSAAEDIMSEVESWPMHGPWVSFKAADMVEVVMNRHVVFSTNIPMIYKEPRTSLHELSEIERVEPTQYLQYLLREFEQFGEPARGLRRCGVQEVETILCKHKSHRRGHYPVGKDTAEVRHALVGWGATAEKLLQHCPGGAAS
jgi:hypothetical protein